MSANLELVERRMTNLRMVHEVVHSMRALSAVQFRQSSAHLDHVRGYARQLTRTMRHFAHIDPVIARPRQHILVVFGADQGLCGSLNRCVVEKTINHIAKLREACHGVLAIGTRLAHELSAAGIDALGQHRSAISLKSIDTVVQWIADSIDDIFQQDRQLGVHVIYTPMHGVGRGAVEVRQIVPAQIEDEIPHPDLKQRESRPYFYEPPDDVLNSILREWAYIEMYRCAVESLASEHGARLRTTDSATHALEKKIAKLKLEHNHLRQEMVTEEILETVAGANATGHS